MAARKNNSLKLAPWQRSMWEDLWSDGSQGHCNKEGVFPADSNNVIWVMLKSGVELTGRMDQLWAGSGGICIERQNQHPRHMDIDIREVAAYCWWDATATQ